MNRTIVVVTGNGVAPSGAIQRLALAGADHARARGLKLDRLKASHVNGSTSQYLYLRDRQARPWLIRVSNHHRPRRAANFETPNFNLVSIDGVAGQASLEFFLDEIAAGRAGWFDPMATCRPRAKKGTRR